MLSRISLTKFLSFSIIFCTASLNLTLLTSCTKKNGPKDVSSLKIALSASPATLDPRRATDATGMRMVNLIFQGLVRLNERLEAEGDAAETWTYKDKTYRFVLKNDLRFQNNRPVSKEDIEFSFSEFMSERSPFSSAFKPIEQVKVSSENHRLIVEVKVKDYSAKFLTSDLPVIKILPKKEALDAGEIFGERPIGSGPLKVTAYDMQQVVFERVPHASLDSGLFNQFHFKVIRDDFTRSQKILKGEIDAAIAELPPDIVSRLQKKHSDELQILTYPGLSMTYILLNLKDPVLKELWVRKALSQAINRSELIEYKLLGLGEEATSILTPSNQFFNSDLKNPKFDLEAAKSQLKGIPTLSLKTSSNPSAIDHGKVIAYQLNQTGVKVTLNSFEWGTFYNDIKTGNFQMATMKWVGASDPDIYRIAFHSKELSPGRNRSYYINKELDQIMDQAFQIESFEKRKQSYQLIQKKIFDDYAIIPLWYETQAAVLRKGLSGYKTSPLSDYYALLNVTLEKK